MVEFIGGFFRVRRVIRNKHIMENLVAGILIAQFLQLRINNRLAFRAFFFERIRFLSARRTRAGRLPRARRTAAVLVFRPPRHYNSVSGVASNS